MGLLDDAIREHLELKRRHGASDDEVERKAAEAFGPVRRERPLDEPVAAEEPLPAEQPLAADEPAGAYAFEPEPEPEDAADPYAGMPAYDEPLGAEPPPAEPASLEHEPEPLDHAPEPLDHAPEPLDAGEPAVEWEEPEPPRGGTPPRGFPAVAGDPGEPNAADQDADDVLEETPDFLQDAPEHDRLWFEQRPPRDFDFDE